MDGYDVLHDVLPNVLVNVLALARSPGGQPALVQGENPPTRKVVEGREGEDISEGELCLGAEPRGVEGAGGDQPEAQPFAPFATLSAKKEGARQGGDRAQANQGVFDRHARGDSREGLGARDRARGRLSGLACQCGSRQGENQGRDPQGRRVGIGLS
jgi:hypothetical protein